MNELRFKGLVEKVTLKNDKVVKFTLLSRKNKRITATIFNGSATRHLYEQVEELIGQLVIITGEVYETSYKDKKSDQWINSYCVCINNMNSAQEAIM